MSKNKKCIIILLVIITVVIFIWCKNANNDENNIYINKQLEEYKEDGLDYSYDEIIKKIYVPNSELMLKSHAITEKEISKILPYNLNIETEEGKIIEYISTSGKKVDVYFDNTGRLIKMIFDVENLLASDIYNKIEEGMSYEQVKRIIPYAILRNEYSEILGGGTCENLTMELMFKDGYRATLSYKKENKEYYVKEKGELEKF